MNRIFIAESFPLMAEGIKQTLFTFLPPCKVHTCHSKEQLSTSLLQSIPDVLLLDPALGAPEELHFCQQLKKEYPSLKIILLSALEHPTMVSKFLRSKVDGFLLRTANALELQTALESVYQGKQYLQAQIKEIAACHSLGILPKKRYHGILDLTRREKEILPMVLEGRKTREIAQELHIEPKTIEFHRRNLLVKLDARNTAEMVRKAIEMDLYVPSGS